MIRHAILFASILVGAVVVAPDATAAPNDAPAVDKAALREELAARRKLNLQRFRDYRLARIYPHNSYEPGLLNVWTDADGHLCAVATLIDKDGLKQLVEKTGKDNNLIRLADVTSGPLVDWALTSGFTQEELVMIQQPSAADIERMEWEERRRNREFARARRREDDRLETNYLAISKALKQDVVERAGLDLAVARLAARPDLAKALHTQVAKAKADDEAAAKAKAEARAKTKKKPAKRG